MLFVRYEFAEKPKISRLTAESDSLIAVVDSMKAMRYIPCDPCSMTTRQQLAWTEHQMTVAGVEMARLKQKNDSLRRLR
jgi:hypothetical protein